MMEYTESTTIHGIKYLGAKGRPLCERLFWMIIFGLCFLFLSFFIHDILTKWQQKAFLVVEDDQPTPIYKIPFPAVTLCPTVKIKKRFLSFQEYDSFVNEESSKTMAIELAQQLCNQQFINPITPINSSFFGFYETSHIREMHRISPSFEETFKFINFGEHSYQVLNYQYSDREMENYTLFSPILTNEGVCFTFNLPSEIITNDSSIQTDYKLYNFVKPINGWDYEEGYNKYPCFPRITWGTGPRNGLKLMVQSDSDDIYTICQPTNVGYKIILHSPAIYPTTFINFIPIDHNTVTSIKVTPRIIKTSNDLRRHDPQMRQCFYNNERKLRYYKFYNRANCKLECLANYTLQQYNCVHFFLPHDRNQSICGGNIKINDLFETEENLNSYFQFRAEVLNVTDGVPEMGYHYPEGFANFSFQCNCLPECNSLEYEYSVYSEDVELEKMRVKENRPLSKTVTKLSEVHVFFENTKSTGKTRKQYYTFVDLVSNFGGLVGLFMGASVLSIFEIIYFFIVRKLTKTASVVG